MRTNLFAYLEKISNDLAVSVSNSKLGTSISRYSFNKYLSIPIVISNRLFNKMCDNEAMTKDQFVTGLFKLLIAKTKAKRRILFGMMDIEERGLIGEKEIQLFINFLLPGFNLDKAFPKKPNMSLDQVAEVDLFDLFYNEIVKNIMSSPSVEYYTAGVRCAYSDTDVRGRCLQIEGENEDCSSDEERLLTELEDTRPDIKLPQFKKIKNKFFNDGITDEYTITEQCKVSKTQIETCEVKMNPTYEGYAYRSKSNGSFKKIWLVLLGRDLYYFKSKSREQIRDIRNLSTAFVSEVKLTKLKGVDAYSFTIYFNKPQVFICTKRDDATKWVNNIKKVNGQRDIKLEYEILNTLGEGGFAKVKLGINKQTGSKCAIKVLDKSKLTTEDLERVITERDILKHCNHRNIVSYIDSYEDKDYIYLIMEYMEFDLINYLQTCSTKLHENKVRWIIKEVAEGVKYLHYNGLMHRDLKLDNIMISRTSDGFTVKLTDFGLSDITSRQTCKYKCGTIYYIAPEMIQNLNYNCSIDIWSIGVVLYYLLFHKLPWNGDDEDHVSRNICKKDLYIPDKCSMEVKDLLMKCLEKTPRDRISCDELIIHPWLL
jgi:hypothetical protein